MTGASAAAASALERSAFCAASSCRVNSFKTSKRIFRAGETFALSALSASASEMHSAAATYSSNPCLRSAWPIRIGFLRYRLRSASLDCFGGFCRCDPDLAGSTSRRPGSPSCAAAAFAFASARGLLRRMDARFVGEEIDARRLEGEECAVLARGFALLVGMGEEIRFEDAHREAVERVAMRRAENVAGLRRLRTARPARGVARRVHEADAERNGDHGREKRNRKTDPSTAQPHVRQEPDGKSRAATPLRMTIHSTRRRKRATNRHVAKQASLLKAAASPLRGQAAALHRRRTRLRIESAA